MIYFISYGDYDTYMPRIVEGPEVDDWIAYCNSLIPEAAQRSVTEEERWIGWGEITERLVTILLERGYTLLQPTECLIEGTGIIKTPEDGHGRMTSEQVVAIIQHNREFGHTLDSRKS